MKKIHMQDGDIAVFLIDGKEVEVSKMSITPEAATSIIEQSDLKFSNRKARRAQVAAYSKDMRNDVWKVNGESIKFRKDGALIDGRHRLMAVAESGIPCDFLAVGNLDNGVEDSIDIGMLRSFEAMLDFNGVHHEPAVKTVVFNKLKLDKRSRGLSQNTTNAGYTKMDCIKEFIDNSDIYNDSVNLAKSITCGQKVLTKTEVATIYLHLTETLGWDKNFVEMFFKQLVGVSYNGRSIFNTTMVKLSNKAKYRPFRQERINVFIACWNSYVIGNRQNISEKKAASEWFLTPNDSKVQTVNATVGNLNQIQRLLDNHA